MTRRIGDRLRSWLTDALRPTGPPPRPTRRNLAFDIVLALILAIAAIRYAVVDGPVLVFSDGQDLPDAPGTPTPPVQLVDSDTRQQGAAVALISSVALVLRRRYPLAVLCFVVVLTGATISDEPRFAFYALAVAAYSAAAYSPYRVPTIAAVGAAVLVLTVTGDSGVPVLPSGSVPLLVLVPIVVAADGLRRWKVLQRDQAETARRAAADERQRIARELHDVVTHNVSVMVIQAGAARTVLTAAPGQAQVALRAVEAGGRAALAELRQVMGLLGTDDSTGPDAATVPDPQPGLDRLQALVDRVRAAGLPVALSVEGAVRALPPGVELAGYRVVQEALTNTMKHAAGAAATVTVDYGHDRLRIEVVDTGGNPTGSSTGNGRGLSGLRDRVAVYGGTLDSEHRLTGGYRVAAAIPVEAP